MSLDNFSRIGAWIKISKISGPQDFEKIEILSGYLKVPCMKNLPLLEYCCIDESMISFKGHHKLKQYLPNKPTKWGFKVFLLCDPFQGYVYKFNFFKGGTDYYPYNITMELVTGLEHLNIHLTVDNWYSSVKLIEDLLVIKGITTTCTMKKNATGMPTDFKIASKSFKNE